MLAKKSVMNTHLFISEDLSTVLKTQPLPHEDFGGMRFYKYTIGSTDAERQEIFRLEKLNG